LTGDVPVSYLLVSFVDVFGNGGEVCVEFAGRLHNGSSVWGVLETSKHIAVRKHVFGEKVNTC
jgi:hypothetical protein